MQRSSIILAGFAFAAGIAVGCFVNSPTPILRAVEDEQIEEYSKDIRLAYRNSRKALTELKNLFDAQGTQTSAFSGSDLNYFAASVGGIDVEKDLEEGRGVDPETFAGLYADRANAKIAEHLDYDEQGRLRYKKNVIRMYSRDRLKQVFDRRSQLEIQSENTYR